jgi:hypothetical protein
MTTLAYNFTHTVFILRKKVLRNICHVTSGTLIKRFRNFSRDLAQIHVINSFTLLRGNARMLDKYAAFVPKTFR